MPPPLQRQQRQGTCASYVLLRTVTNAGGRPARAAGRPPKSTAGSAVARSLPEPCVLRRRNRAGREDDLAGVADHRTDAVDRVDRPVGDIPRALGQRLATGGP